MGAKRLKRVFANHREVLHLWANQAQSDARSENVFFEGDTCYSYGYHYPLAKLVKYRGHTVALINANGYSVTTSKHIRSARSAASHLITLDVDGYQGLSERCISSALLRLQGSLIETLFNHFNGRSFWSGARWENSLKNERRCLIVDIYYTYNLLGKLVKFRYVAQHEFMGQLVTDYDVPETSVDMGDPK
jgi:hypothetical protein